MRIEESVSIDASPEEIWEIVTDPSQFPKFADSITRWDAKGDKERGLGARYSMRMRAGSAEIGGLVEVVEWDEYSDMAWTSVTGIDQRGRWRLRPRADGATDVTLRLSYHAEGGLLGVITDRVAAPIVGGNLKRSLAELKRTLERQGAVIGAH